ncbi:DUF4249 domain-containing protein [bacterium]|nr:DUF4249 domain-containing protein [bacterium]
MKIRILFIAALFAVSCGEGKIDISSQKYEPKIVIEGYLTPQHKVERIHISRNFPLDAVIDPEDIPIADAQVTITDLASMTEYPLTYNVDSSYFEYNGVGLDIGFNKSYRLNVTAVIDGQTLMANSTTTTPQSGFSIIPELSTLDSMVYRKKNSTGQLEFFKVAFNRSPGVDFYLVTMIARNPSVESFIYSPANPFGDVDSSDVVKDMEDYRHDDDDWLMNPNLGPGTTTFDLEWFLMWFYGEYQMTMYACDKNYKDFAITNDDVQEEDGNFHQPVLHINGDGIGVFGSVIADTAYIKVLKQ